ncbi:hypothetical protein GYMLUDRAFT_61885 [Collybiopsis luxurians FD-317 M1]|uniref:Uncharacterized protein n=1 Tax=Collybiopsis luxurians FD-317 M1 TaxID=944289 RepID=A0A0D0CN05_9AGAR|nr:hypothetical protein GYMLUDRAFT_61885 [Collybiopsis luxurians FD-317 M1]
MHILERAHSFSKLNHKQPSGEGSSAAVDKQFRSDEEEEPETTDREYESESDSSRTEGHGARSKRSKSPPSHDEQEGEYPPDPELSHLPAKARSWYEFDLAVVAALVSPIGHWLTGGDHIKNVFFVLLLIFYLHQVIEIPWTLYHNSRPRLHPRSSRTSAAESLRAKHAASELRVLEFIFFSFAIVSPFLGASLLRYVTFAITGQDIHSWFSIGLFVLATGVRPWTHLVQRFTQRITDLHDIVHYDSAAKGDSEDVSEMKQQLELLRSRMAEMEDSVLRLRKKLLKETNEVYDYVDEQVDPVEQMVKKHDKALEYVLHLPSTLLVPGPSRAQPKLSPVSSPSATTLKYCHSPNHSGASSPVPTKLETIHEEGTSMGFGTGTLGALGTRPNIGVPLPKTVIVKSPPPSPTEPWPPAVLKPLIVVMSLMTLPAYIFVRGLYTVTFPFRWCFWKVVHLSGVERRIGLVWR